MSALDRYPRTTVPTPFGAAGGDWTIRTTLSALFSFAALAQCALGAMRGNTTSAPKFAALALAAAAILTIAWPYATAYAPLIFRYLRWMANTTETAARRLSIPADPRMFAWIFGRSINTRVAIMSIHREEAPHVYTDTAPVLIRRRRIQDDTTHVLLYETSPVQRVTGIARVKTVHMGAPIVLAAIFGRHMTHVFDDFYDYTHGRRTVAAIELHHVREFPEPITLDEACALEHAPYGAQYLTVDGRATLCDTLLGIAGGAPDASDAPPHLRNLKPAGSPA